MKKRAIAAGTVVVGLTAAIVSAQVPHTNGQNTRRAVPSIIMAPLTPTQRTGIVQAGDLAIAAKAALNSGNYAMAEADARQSEATGPDSGLAQEVLAASLYAQGKTREALQAYQIIADGGANAARNEWPYALLLLKAGHWAQAVAAYDTALRLGGDVDVLRANTGFSPDVPQPTDLEAAIHIGWGIIQDGGDFHGTYQNRSQQALSHFQQAQALELNNALANYYYGYGLRRLHRWTDAQAAFKKAAALDQGTGDVKAAAEDALAGR